MKKNKFFSNIVAIGLAVLLSAGILTSTKAANVATVLSVVTNRTALLTNAVHLNSITVYNMGTSATVFGFFDAPGNTNLHSANAISLAQTNSGFTNYTFTIASFTNTYTNIFGFITNDIYTAMNRTTNAQPATNAPYGLIGVIAVGTNPVTLTFNALQFCNYGLIVTNLTVPVGVVGINVDYNPLR